MSGASTIEEMALTFGIEKTAEGGGRRASLTLPHGVVQTPVFMPVGTVASVKAVEQGVLERIGPDRRGAEIILARTKSVNSARCELWAQT